MAVHLTPTELADELEMKRRDVLTKCVEMNVPVLKGRIDRTLFESSLRAPSRARASRPRPSRPIRIEPGQAARLPRLDS